MTTSSLRYPTNPIYYHHNTMKEIRVDPTDRTVGVSATVTLINKVKLADGHQDVDGDKVASQLMESEESNANDVIKEEDKGNGNPCGCKCRV